MAEPDAKTSPPTTTESREHQAEVVASGVEKSIAFGKSVISGAAAGVTIGSAIEAAAGLFGGVGIIVGALAGAGISALVTRAARAESSDAQPAKGFSEASKSE